MSQALYDLPEGWELKKLGDLTTLITKGTTPTTHGYKFEESGINFIKIESIVSGEINQKSINSFISKEAHDFLSRSKLQKGDLLFSIAGSIGTAALVEEHILPANTNQALAIIRGYDEFLHAKFLLYVLRSELLETTRSKSRGGALQNISLGDIKDALIPLPPLAEQTRIVEKLDAVLFRIDTAIDELQQSLALVDAMFKSGLDKAFNPLGSPTNEVGLYDLPDGWGWKSLGNISTIGTGVTPLKGRTDFYQNGNINWVTSKATGQDFVIDSEEKITDIALSECRLKTYPIGTLIIALYGQGKTRGQVSELLIESTINQALAAVVVDTEYHVKFVKYFLKKSYLALRDKASGGTQENLNLSIVKAIQIPLPNLAEQQQVVEALDALNDKTTQLKTELTAKIGMFNQLKASVLDGAFRGLI